MVVCVNFVSKVSVNQFSKSEARENTFFIRSLKKKLKIRELWGGGDFPPIPNPSGGRLNPVGPSSTQCNLTYFYLK